MLRNQQKRRKVAKMANRYDMATGLQLTSPAVFHPDGSMTAKPIITSIGVFSYKKPNGKIQRELRTPEVVFDQAFLDSIKNMPIYIQHQSNKDGSLITDEFQRNALAVGRTDSFPDGNNVYVSVGITINRADGVDAIKKGMQSLSVGYSCDLLDESGVWGGVEYDKVQTNLRADHLALCYAGRQGDQAIIRMDSDDAELVTEATVDVVENIEPNEESVMADNMKTVKIDTVDYQCEAPVAVELNKVMVKLDSTEKELVAKTAGMSALEAERDSLKERLDAVDKKVLELEASRVDEAMIADRVAKRVVLMDLAKKAEVEVKLDAADLDVKKAIIMKVYANAKLDGKDEAYINARFDCACEDMEKAVVAVADASVRAAGAVATVNVDSADKETIAKRAYMERLQNGYKDVNKENK